MRRRRTKPVDTTLRSSASLRSTSAPVLLCPIAEFRKRFGEVFDAYEGLEQKDIVGALRDAEQVVKSNIAGCDVSAINPNGLSVLLRNHIGSIAAHRLAWRLGGDPLAFRGEYEAATTWLQMARQGRFARPDDGEDEEPMDLPRPVGKPRVEPWTEEG